MEKDQIDKVKPLSFNKEQMSSRFLLLPDAFVTACCQLLWADWPRL